MLAKKVSVETNATNDILVGNFPSRNQTYKVNGKDFEITKLDFKAELTAMTLRDKNSNYQIDIIKKF